MSWLPAEGRTVAALALVLLLPGCDRDDRDEEAEEPSSAADSGRALQLADPELFAICDSLEYWLDEAMPDEPERMNGRFTGSVHGNTRYGCRITSADTIAPDLPQRPLERVWQTLAARGWTVDQSYVADGPEGSMLGLRSRSLLCVLQHYWQAPSDDERATNPEAPFQYDVGIECFREASRNSDTG